MTYSGHMNSDIKKIQVSAFEFWEEVQEVLYDGLMSSFKIT